MGNAFSEIFLPIFCTLFIGVIIACVWPRLPKRRQNCITYGSQDSTELANIATNSADINRISTALAFPPNPAVRVFDGPPRSAHSARRREDLEAQNQDPFRDPPSYNHSVASFRTATTAGSEYYHQDCPHTTTVYPRAIAPEPASYPNFSTPTRQPRMSSSPNTFSTPSRSTTAPSVPHPQIPPRAHILPQPEPRSAGRAPSLAPQLAKFPIPDLMRPMESHYPRALPTSSSSHRHLHPNKLFSNLSLHNSSTAATTTAPAEASSSPVLPSISPILAARDASFETTMSPISSIHEEDSGGAAGGVDIRASSVYSRNEEGKPVRGAPGGAEWI
ncbi:uncharacterized protein AB675_1447 [Cyphellophora attinorum]|uniref:Uncharacterized protein n=1 Tax=Cyphellophora attinorum TaxID=1664694 RepID=A0A0N1NWX5_9EURO|nr:uncharacterized protein AB675_1447 [Phialophora attinorum]KPI37280.1 hypothetical protein AB675_1447 [Phialophora attinorum]